jgi:hypothetical protein
MAFSSSENGIDETRWSTAYSALTPSDDATTLTARPSAWRILVTGVSKMTLVPAASTSSWQRSHIIPGPYLGYWNSSMRLVTCSLLLLRAPRTRDRIGSHTALHSDIPLMRWAPQSADMSLADTPQTFML